MSLSPIPVKQTIDRDRKVFLDPQWLAWLQSVQLWLFPNGNNGTTANRPTTNLYTGQQFFDTTLGFPVYLKSQNPTVWVRYDGTPV